ncbi:chromatin assembly factor 1 subunit A-domain-containing protein [Chaetomidium leptoderma]|uniref:Chromatin assembly factor 1 subunit A-domain-containing protein n=1 Tax=Chaetomidium leptoderma TaxID=669021 RepID=A0AAN6VWW3_9PEZI|nr:chromatin assembly factor 1 subunit A-domain-containing protein [Chaetomidium leptoderma]
MSPDVQDRDLASRKRSHGDFLNQESCGAVVFRDSEHIQDDHSLSDKENDVRCASLGASASPASRASSGLSEPACSPLDGNSPSPTPNPASRSTSAAPTQPSTAKLTALKAAGEPPKKKRATSQEKAAKDAAMKIEKDKRQEEREKKKREKEEAEKLKAELKAEQKAAKAADKEQEKKQRAEEKEKKKREKDEEEAKKTRSQMKLTSMFNRTATTPKKKPAVPKSEDAKLAGAASKSEVKEPTVYEQMFQPFFVKEHVRLASTVLQLDEETREAKTKILDEYLSGGREQPISRFEPLEALQIPYKVRRGRVYPSVRKMMSEFESLSSNAAGDLNTESQNAQIRHIMEALKSVPVKSIKFREDVRPPYIGTISGLPTGVKSLQKLARRPTSKILPLNYEYDSEAEWQEEEGEDVDDLDEEEDEAEQDEDMDDFLDDSEDIGPARRVFVGGIEPESTGPCWEDRTRRTEEQKLYKYRLEFILEPLEHRHSIDPFSSAYWETPKSKASTGNESSAASASTSTPATTASLLPASSSAQDARTNPMAPPPAPSDAFQALNPGSAGTKKSQQPLPLDMQQKLKDLVRSMPNLSKVGVIELFAASNVGCPRAQIKTSFDALFEKSGKVFKVKGE